MLRGPVEELDLGSDGDSDEGLELPPAKLKSKKSKQQARPMKIIPTASDASSDEEDEDDEDDDEEEDPGAERGKKRAKVRELTLPPC